MESSSALSPDGHCFMFPLILFLKKVQVGATVVEVTGTRGKGIQALLESLAIAKNNAAPPNALKKRVL